MFSTALASMRRTKTASSKAFWCSTSSIFRSRSPSSSPSSPLGMQTPTAFRYRSIHSTSTKLPSTYFITDLSTMLTVAPFMKAYCTSLDGCCSSAISPCSVSKSCEASRTFCRADFGEPALWIRYSISAKASLPWVISFSEHILFSHFRCISESDSWRSWSSPCCSFPSACCSLPSIRIPLMVSSALIKHRASSLYALLMSLLKYTSISDKAPTTESGLRSLSTGECL
mmetsp:Transcript_39669/g.64565  ORF Transcript_39669/g.64565 Transcript_39669/m.64565 type:complete len:228 (-) Transcript_39669:103-786(-)